MIHIQSDRERTRPHHFDASCAMWGAIESGLDYRLTSFEEVQSGKFDAHVRKNLFVGSVEFIREVFNRIGLKDIGVPKNSDRVHQTYNLREVKEIVATGKKLFIKPYQIKLFTGFVLDQCKYTCLNNVPDDTLLMVYEPFESKILSEWRIYIHNNKMVDSRNYSGDFIFAPNYFYVVERINNFCNKNAFPSAYTMDIAVLGDGGNYGKENQIIECNDMWAIGSYGIPNDMYLQLLTDRYFEIVK